MPKPIKIDKSPDMPKFGETLSADHFHISKLNARVDEPFGNSEEDKLLIENLRRGKTVQPFKARPEGKGFGIYVGRRRYLARIANGTKRFVVGQDVLIDNIADDEARENSLVENLTVLREEMNPLLRAKKVQELIDFNMIGLRAVARKLGLAPSTLSEWTKILELHKPMQDAVGKGLIFYKDALTLAKLKPGEIQEEELAKVLEKQGREAFMDEVVKLQTGQEKRGIPKGKYIVIRTMFDKDQDSKLYQQLEGLAKAKNMMLDEYSKWVLTEHVKSLL
jgi:ParB/RepB/Spo0J family partition protein